MRGVLVRRAPGDGFLIASLPRGTQSPLRKRGKDRARSAAQGTKANSPGAGLSRTICMLARFIKTSRWPLPTLPPQAREGHRMTLLRLRGRVGGGRSAKTATRKPDAQFTLFVRQ